MRLKFFFLSMGTLGLVPVFSQINLSGRVLEQANLAPVPGALVAIAGTQLSTLTDTAGKFTLNGTTAVRPVEGALFPEWPMLQGRYLRVPAAWSGQSIRIEAFDSRGARLSTRSAAPPATGDRLDLLPEMEAGSRTALFLRLSAAGEAYRFRIAGMDYVGANSVADLPAAALAKTAASNVSVDFSVNLLMPKTMVVPPDSGNLGDIILQYPPRQVDTGSPPIYGAIDLFSGSRDSAAARAQLDSNWIMWVGPSSPAGMGPTPILWKSLHDPQAETNPDRWTFSECCAPTPGGATWGYNDIVTKQHFNDYQLHVEFNMMGTPGDEDTGGYCNSGVYQENRYELQIETVPTPWDPTNSHGMASIINEYPPPANYSRPGGIWQAYDITFRNDRWKNGKRVDSARTTIWWNGHLIHNNDKIVGAVACCDNGNVKIDSTLQGLKLQNEEGADVRFRNIWIKPLTITDTETNFGY